MNAAGTAGNVAATAANGTDVDIHGGIFTRAALTPAPTLDQLRASGVLSEYVLNVNGVNAGTVGEGGVSVALPVNGATTLAAHAEGIAGGELIWMQNLTISGNQATLGARSTISVVANANGNDGEIGVRHVSLSQTSASAIDSVQSALEIDANALGGGTAITHVGDVSVTANGDDAYAYANYIQADASAGGTARVIIDGDVAFSSTARAAHTYSLFAANGTIGSTADVHVGGNVTLNSQGTDQALMRALAHATGSGSIIIDGHIQATGQAGGSNAFMQFTATEQASVNVGGIIVDTGSGSGHTWLDFYSDHAGGVTVGSVDITMNASSDATINVQHANPALGGVTGEGFQAHGNGVGDLSIGSVTLHGPGDATLNLNSQAIGTINQNNVNLLTINYQLADQDYTSIGNGTGQAHVTQINGFSGAADAVIFDGTAATGANFANAGNVGGSVADLAAALDTALDATHRYVFAVYTGSGDINGDGVADTNAGVLAFDGDGIGLTAVLLLPGTTTLTPADLA